MNTPVSADADTVRRLRAEFRELLLAHQVAEGVVDAVELGLDEVLMNALDSGLDPQGGGVQLRVSLYPDRVFVEVADRGPTPFQPGSDEAGLPDDDSESGRGLFLILNTMDEVSFHPRDGGGTLVRMTKRF